MDLSKLNYPSVENRLNAVLREYFQEKLGGSQEDFLKWYEAIGRVTEGWKMMDKDKNSIGRINEEYGVPEWFMRAIHATL